MGTTEVAFLERLVSGSPLIVAASFVAIYVLWSRMNTREATFDKRLQEREEKSDVMVREMLDVTHKMTAAVEALTDAIKHPPR